MLQSAEIIALTRPITTTAELADFCARMAAHPFVTVDTEFLRESTYYPLLCVAQMASADEAAVIDALAPGIDLSRLLCADGRQEDREGLSRRAPGHRNHLARGEAHSTSDLRHPGRRHGARLRRFDFLRPARAAHHRRCARQVAPLHRLDAAAPVGRAARLRDFRRHAPARRLSGALGRPRTARPRRLGRGRNERAHLAGHLPDGAGKRLAAAEDARAQAEGTRRADRSRRLARARGTGARRAARARAQRRGHRRHRRARTDHDRKAQAPALAAQGASSVRAGARRS